MRAKTNPATRERHLNNILLICDIMGPKHDWLVLLLPDNYPFLRRRRPWPCRSSSMFSRRNANKSQAHEAKPERRPIPAAKQLPKAVDVDREAAPPTVAMLRHHSTSIDRAGVRRFRVLSKEDPSDIMVVAGERSFTLHKFALASKCGYICRKLVSEHDDNVSFLEIPDIPGGAEAFELAVGFCYGTEPEITAENVAMLRCAAEHLEMTEEYSTGNLVGRTENYLEEVALASLSSAVTVLRCSEGLLPLAETVKMVSRCVDTIAGLVCDGGTGFCLGTGEERWESSISLVPSQPKALVDWWAEDLTALRIDMFCRVLLAMKARGFEPYALAAVLMLYAHKSLRGLDTLGRGRKKMDRRKENEKRVVVETIVGLLPKEKNAMSVSFLSVLLRAAVYLETTIACRLDLEKRIGSQLERAALNDLLIPSFSFAGDTVFDVDTVQSILVNYLEHEVGGHTTDNEDEYAAPSPSHVEKVGKLMECYLAEIAADPNLPVSKFVGLAELIPEKARITEDGMYRAIDIYLKAHPSITDAEMKKICSAMDCQRLSREACAHAAQNRRLPVQVVVQVLFYEQERLRDATVGGGLHLEGSSSTSPGSHATDELSHLRKQNDELKLELSRMKTRLREPDGDGQLTIPDKLPLHGGRSLINSVSRKLGRLNPFVRSSESARADKAHARRLKRKDRRHSIS